MTIAVNALQSLSRIVLVLFLLVLHATVSAEALVSGEVFLDNPAATPGTGTALVLDSGGDPFSAASAALDLTGVAPGVHTLYTRFHDDQSEWSAPLGQTLYVTEGNPVSPFSGGENVVIAGEAYIDMDPGEGNGTPLDVAADGAIDSTMEILGGVIPLNSLSIGPHVLHIRVLDRTGIWSPPIGQTFFVPDTILPGTTGQVKLVAAEGEIDGDPAIALPADDGSFDDLVETVSLTASVGSGYHSAQIRFQDTQGLWSKEVASDCTGNGVLSGTLLDATTRQALAGVTITIGSSSVVTDSQGYYLIENLPCTQQQISVNVAGFEGYSRTYDLSAGWWNIIRLTRTGTTLGANPESAIYGDPVNTATGNYVYQRRDLELPGIGLLLQFDRTYNSRAASDALATEGPLGYGWSHGYEASLVESAGVVTITWGDGKTQTWALDGMGGFIPQYGVFDDLIDDGGGAYTLRKKDLTRYHFDAGGHLSSIVDKNGNTISLTYTASKLTQITDTAGRVLTLGYDLSNRLTQITDPISRTIQFAYDLNGDLVTATDANGNVTTYTYDASHQILTVVDPRGNTVVSNTYDGANRVVTYQTDAKGGATSYSYQTLDRITTITDALGNVMTHHHDELLRLIKEVDALGHEALYEYDVAGNRIKVTDKNGNLTQYGYDAYGNVTTKTDALGQVTTITYDSQNNPLSRTDALGHVTQFQYDTNGNLTQSTDALGNTASVTYTAAGQPQTLTDALGHVTTHAYDAEGNRIQTTDALGHVTTHTYDGVGRRLSSTDPLGRITTYSYDANDNLLTVTDPLGNAVTHTYDGNNNRLSTLDRNGNLASFSYDEKDLLTSNTDALGNITTNTYDALDRKIAVTDARGNTTQYAYDAVGNQTQVTDALGNITQFTYDPNGNRLSATDALGHTTTYQYDSLNRRTKITDPLGQSTTTAYDPLGQVVSMTSALGQVTANTYDVLGRLIQVTNALGGTTQHSYDANGNRLSTTDPRGNTSTFGYDALDRRVTVTDALGNSATTVYDAAGQVVSVTDKRGNTTTSAYDAAGRLIQITDALGNVTQHSYDAKGNRLSTTDALGRVVSAAYDVLDRVVSHTDATGAVATISYDAAGNVVSETDRNSHTTQYTYDAVNRRVQVTNALGHSTQVAYDAVGNRISVTDALGHVTATSFDANNRPITTTDPLGNVTTTAYDPVGRVTTSTNANGQVTTFGYDLLDRLIQVTDTQGGVVHYSYDANGNRLSMTDPNGNITVYSFDVLNRLTTTTEALAHVTALQYDAAGNVTQRTDARGLVTQYSYDPLNRLVTTAYPGPKTVTFTYDAVGNRRQMADSLGTTTTVFDSRNRITQVTDPYGQSVQYGYDDEGNRTSLTYPGNKTVGYAYDAADRLVAVVDWLGHATTYQYDAANRLLQTGLPNGAAASYGYDANDRLTSLLNSKSDASVISSYSYVLDSLGNQLSEDRQEPLTPTIAVILGTHSYDAENRLADTNGIVNAFDNNGNQTSKAGNSYAYDEENRLIQSVTSNGTTDFGYDGLGNRYSRNAGGGVTRFVLDSNTALTNALAETDGAGNVQFYNVYGLGLISRIEQDNTTHFYHYDSRGSTVAITDAAEAITDSYAYDPFGHVVDSSGAGANPFQYLGRHGVLHEGGDLNYIRARYYDAGKMRFVSKDSYRGKDTQTQSLNRYLYALNSPVIVIDTSGYFSISAFTDSLVYRSELLLTSVSQVAASAGEVAGALVDVGISGTAALATSHPGAVAKFGVSFAAAYDGINEASKQFNASLVNLTRAVSWNKRDSYWDAAVFAEDMDGTGILDQTLYKNQAAKRFVKTAKVTNMLVSIASLAKNGPRMAGGIGGWLSGTGSYGSLNELQQLEYLKFAKSWASNVGKMIECRWTTSCPPVDAFQELLTSASEHTDQLKIPEYLDSNQESLNLASHYANHPNIPEINEASQKSSISSSPLKKELH